MDLRLTQCPCVKAASWAHALESASLCVQRRWSSGNLLWLEHSRFKKQFSVAHKKSITALWFGFFALFCHSRCQRVYMMRGAHFSRRPWSVRREMRTRSTYCAAGARWCITVLSATKQFGRRIVKRHQRARRQSNLHKRERERERWDVVDG